MSQFLRCFRRPRAQESLLNNSTHPSYGAIEATLAGVHGIETRNRLLNHPLIRKTYGKGILGKTIVVFLAILFTLICIAIMATLTSAFCGACFVAGHWILLHLSCPRSPYSHVSFWSTFLVGFWGAMAAFLPFGVLTVSPQACFRRASERAVKRFKFVLIIVWVGVDCVVGVPLVEYFYGIETLGLEYAVGAAYTAWALGCFVFTVAVLCMLRAV
ncbi:hypothetical protein IW261DRAFT_1611756 [Armillaria novae-zelandiae]|uniref:Uncharacterized protein n=1 Tax=Armillaria novae-zelandiae TaxID=153914 RepID=A0AA39TWG7_9AGAR|nr:hypothetical protein IW261DRAFT_1611756 [Armillaria novae-zelandiae]